MNALPGHRDIDRYLGHYSEDHRNLTNQRIHLVCVPAIVWSVIALLWVIPVPAMIGRPGFWAGVAMAAALIFYWRQSRWLALGAFLMFFAFGLICEALYRGWGAGGLLWTAVAVFVIAWIGQFIGHKIEGRRPSFFTDLTYLLIGPLWTLSKLYRKFGLTY